MKYSSFRIYQVASTWVHLRVAAEYCGGGRLACRRAGASRPAENACEIAARRKPATPTRAARCRPHWQPRMPAATDNLEIHPHHIVPKT